VLELLWTEIAQGGMETRSVVDLVDEPRALTGTARAIASFLKITRSRSSPPNSKGCSASCGFSHCGPSNLKVGRSQCIGRLPRPLMIEQSRLPPTSLPANNRAPDPRSAVSRLCAFPADLPTAPSNFW
jgi:hypothetical protein